MTAIHVEFMRSCDAHDAFPTVHAHVPAARLGTSEIEVECRSEDEARLTLELEHALDEWLVESKLPFAPVPVAPHTLLVRPPGD